MSDKGVMCSKCKTTWIKVPETNGKGRVVAMTDQKTHMCPDCMDAVTAYFNTGKLEASCKTCGADAMSICDSSHH
jgi:hypothetical protein